MNDATPHRDGAAGLRDSYDLVVVGAGPAGLAAGRLADELAVFSARRFDVPAVA